VDDEPTLLDRASFGIAEPAERDLLKEMFETLLIVGARREREACAEIARSYYHSTGKQPVAAEIWSAIRDRKD
jgi:hypothetical protein